MIGDLAVTHTHDVDGLELNLAARRRHAKEVSLVRPVIGLVGRHTISIGNLPMDVGVKVGKRGPKNFVELPRTVLIGRASRLRRVIKKIVGEQFFEHFEIPAALDLFGVAADDGLGGFADVVGGHDLLQMGFAFGAPAPAADREAGAPGRARCRTPASEAHTATFIAA